MSASGLPGLADLPPQERIYWWMQRAQAEGVQFPLEAYNARIPQDFVAEIMDRPPQHMELPEPWTEHFRPATEDDLLRLLSGSE